MEYNYNRRGKDGGYRGRGDRNYRGRGRDEERKQAPKPV